MDDVLKDYKAYQDAEAEFRDFAAGRDAEIQERVALRLLTPDELKEYQNLQAVVAPSEEQKRKMEQLRAVAQARESELKALAALSNPTDDEKKRLADLQELAAKSAPEIQELRTRAREEVNARNKELSDKIERTIQQALAAVAKDKRLDLVLDKQLVLWGGVDITADLKAKLAGAP
jgi:Skp family chaperone for outer membrane proteins